MVFNLFKKKDPICGMVKEEGKGINDEKSGKWFCSSGCLQQFRKKQSARTSPSCH